MLDKQIEKAAKSLSLTSEFIGDTLAAMRKKCKRTHKPWLLTQWVNGQCILPEDGDRLCKATATFYTYRHNHPAFKGKHIGDFTFHELEDAAAELGDTDAHDTASGLSTYLNLEGVSVMRRSGDYVSVSITSAKSASAIADGSLGPETRWCTKNEGTAASYLKKGPLNVIFQIVDGKATPIAQFEDFMGGAFMDERDRRIGADHEYVAVDDILICYEKTWEEFWEAIVEMYSQRSLPPPFTEFEYYDRIERAGVRDIPTFVRLSLAGKVPCVLEL